MFVAREKELEVLQNMFEKKMFQMAVVYGRRRVGKTALLEHFSKDKPTLFFTAREQSSKGNLKDFSDQIAKFFELPSELPPFQTWSDAFTFIATKASEFKDPMLLIFDEFPYAAATEPSLPSTLQVALDHEFKNTNILMVLCGSNEGFMESRVLGRKSPLYGRRNAQIRMHPFDYYDAAKMLPKLNAEQLICYYSTFGGTPYYLAQIDQSLSYKENITQLFFSMYGLLYEEPLMFLRQELREPALYNSILGAIASGSTKPKQIAERSGVAYNSISKYLKTLEALGIVEKIVPLGQNPQNSRKGIYRLSEPFFAYWYRFVSPSLSAIESGAGTQVAKAYAFGDTLAIYIGMQFEKICEQWLIRQNNSDKLGFLASEFGKWWGSDPEIHEEVDIDIIAGNKLTKEALFCECKWRNSFNETQTLEVLKQRSKLVPSYTKNKFIIFSKKPVSNTTYNKYEAFDDIRFVCAEELF